MKTLCRILVPMSFSRVAQAALRYAVFLARKQGYQLHLLYVEPAGQDVGVRAKALRALHRVAEQLGVVATVEVQTGRPEDVIAEVAAQGFNRIVMGRGRGGSRDGIPLVDRITEAASCEVISVTSASQRESASVIHLEPQAPPSDMARLSG